MAGSIPPVGWFFIGGIVCPLLIYVAYRALVAFVVSRPDFIEH